MKAVFFDVGETLVDERRYVRKPAPAFFERLVAEAGFEPREVAYVGDRIDNDMEPAAAAGLVAI